VAQTDPPRRPPAKKVRQADELFDRVEAPRAASGREVVRRSFREHMRDGRSAPLGPAVQGLLWAVGLVVALLFGAAIWKMNQRGARKGPGPVVGPRTAAAAPVR
jgi:hypothetical protein